MAYLVMIGVWLRGSALLLGTVTFWASYLKMIELGMEHELGAFWRDLALIAALMLTYCDRDPRDSNKRGIVRRRIVPRKVAKPHPAFVNAVAALPGVKLCIDCQQERDGAQKARGGINRRGSKDSQLK